jgi:TRAP-type uncharacterized transport system substrate-binding protein
MDSFKHEVRDHVVAAYETIRDELKTWWQFACEAWVLILLLIVAISTVIWLAKPAPPTHILMATGTPGGLYEDLAKQYAEFFKKNGVTLELVATKGAEDNINRLKDHEDELQAAFIQGGLLTSRQQAKGLLSLGSIGYEPLWIFYRRALFQVDDLKHHYAFLNHPVAIGAPGSGTYLHALRLLELAHVKLNDNFKTLSNEEAVAAFKNGTVDAVMMVDGLESKNVQAMINDPQARLANFSRAEAFARLLPIYHVLSIPEGSLDLERNEPSKTIKMIAPTTNLVIDPKMHPAIQLLFLQAAEKIHGGRSFFVRYGEFPAYKESIIEESDVAKNFYKNGPPNLMGYMPFWLAEFLHRMWILLLPLVAFTYPIIKSMPGYRMSRIRSRLNEVYGALKLFEQELENNFDPTQQEAYLQKIGELDKKTQNLRVPRSLMSEYYTLRTTIDFVRNLIGRSFSKSEA